MSAFLGPVHYKMYTKIQNTSKFADALAQYLKNICQNESVWQALAVLEPIPTGELEKILQLENIHGSLNRLVNLSETHMAQAAQMIQKQQLVPQALAFAKKHGTETARQLRAENVQELWHKSEEYWVDGMPCDGGVMLREENGFLKVLIKTEIHPAGEIYFTIRTAWFKAFAHQLGFMIQSNQTGEYLIQKEQEQ